ncbi:hypothetical protein DyAD56_07935 [Dyella sp. AD56]|nr:hypothetical protein DyAD56_07935 [Dyella sp. AD56]
MCAVLLAIAGSLAHDVLAAPVSPVGQIDSGAAVAWPRGSVAVVPVIPDSTRQDALLSQAPNLETKRLLAASQFFGVYFMNTRARAEFCSEQGADISMFVSEYVKDNAKEYRVAHALFADYSKSRPHPYDEEDLYRRVRQGALEAVEKDTRELGLDRGISLHDACKVFNDNAQEWANLMRTSVRRPLVEKLLLSPNGN